MSAMVHRRARRLLGWAAQLARGLRCTAQARPRRYRPTLEALENRIVPAFNLTIAGGNAANFNVVNYGGAITAIGSGATLNVSTIYSDLAAGDDVVINNNSQGSEAGNITWSSTADLDVSALPAGRSLIINVDPSAPNGQVTIAGSIFDGTPSTGLRVVINSQGNVDISGIIVAATAPVTVLAGMGGGGYLSVDADAAISGTSVQLQSAGAMSLGSDAVVLGTNLTLDANGVLSEASNAIAQGGSVTVTAQDFQLDTSSDPAILGALAGRVTSIGFAQQEVTAVAADAQGDRFIAGFGFGIVEITPSGTQTEVYSGTSYVASMACDAQGNLYLANVSTEAIDEITPSRTFSTFASVGWADLAVSAIACDAQGDVYLANGDSGTVTKIAPGGMASTVAGGFNGPMRVAVDDAGNVYVAALAEGTITQISPGGHETTIASGFQSPTQIAVDAQGNLYLALAGDGTVRKIAPGGTMTTVASGFNTVNGMAFDGQGYLVVSSLDDGGSVSAISLGQLSIESYDPTRPMNIGGAVGTVNGINLTNAELADLAAANLVFGGPTQTGTITFHNANFPPRGASILVQQASTGPGQIVLDGTSGPALTSAGPVYLAAGTGGIVDGTSTASTIVAPALTLDTAGPVGTNTPIDVQTALLAVGGASMPSGVNIDGVGDLVVDRLQAVPGAIVDLAAPGSLTITQDIDVPGSAAAGSSVSLAADDGGTGTGTLSLTAGATVSASDVRLSAANIVLDTSAVPASIQATAVSITPSTPNLGLQLGSGSATNAVSLTSAELADISAKSLTLFVSSPTANITFAGAACTTGAVSVVEPATGAGQVLFDTRNGAALSDPGATVSLQAGTGGIAQLGSGTGIVAAALDLQTSATIGTLTAPLTTDAATLQTCIALGGLFLADSGDLTTTAPVTTKG